MCADCAVECFTYLTLGLFGPKHICGLTEFVLPWTDSLKSPSSFSKEQPTRPAQTRAEVSNDQQVPNNTQADKSNDGQWGIPFAACTKWRPCSGWPQIIHPAVTQRLFTSASVYTDERNSTLAPAMFRLILCWCFGLCSTTRCVFGAQLYTSTHFLVYHELCVILNQMPCAVQLSGM